MIDPDYQGPERRRYKRIKKQYTVSFSESGQDAKPLWDMVVVRNISAGGVLFNFDRKIEKGSMLNFKINMAYGKKPIQCQGEVIRVKDLGGGATYEIAVNYTDIDPKQSQFIDESAEKFYVKSGGELAD